MSYGPLYATNNSSSNKKNIHRQNHWIIWPQYRCDEFHHLPSSLENQLLGYFPPRDVKADGKETQSYNLHNPVFFCDCFFYISLKLRKKVTICPLYHVVNNRHSDLTISVLAIDSRMGLLYLSTRNLSLYNVVRLKSFSICSSRRIESDITQTVK